MSQPATIIPKINKLVMIDDEELEHMLTRFIVERSGLVGELISFLSAEEAIDYLVEHQEEVDAVLLDLNMPRVTGFDVLDMVQDRLGAEAGGMSFSILTSSVDSRDIQRAESYDIVKEYFSKPLTDDHLTRLATYCG